MNMSEKLPVCEDGVSCVAESNGNHPKAADRSKASLFLLEKLAANRDGVVNAIASKAGECLKMEKSKALHLLLEKIAAHQREIINNVAEKIEDCASVHKSRIVPLLVLSACLVSHAQGYCADAQVSSLDTVTKNVMDVIFSSGIKKSILVLAAGWGLFQAVSSGSFKPLLLWGGIGLAIAYVPKLIEIISNVG